MPIAWLGANMHEYLAVLNGTVNKNRIKKGKRPVDFAALAKKSVKKFIAKKTDYEEEVVENAREHGFEGVVCGHVHRPRITEHEDGFVYINTGDWVEHSTAVVEHLDGRLELIWYRSIPDDETVDEDSAVRRTLDAIKGLVSPTKHD
jgi:UDP-2,3-diacylglucosamine pyrophosphatase LpxH